MAKNNELNSEETEIQLESLRTHLDNVKTEINKLTDKQVKIEKLIDKLTHGE